MSHPLEPGDDGSNMWCDNHWQWALYSGVDPVLVSIVLLDHLLHAPEFCAIVPLPRTEWEITMAFCAITPVCCWLGDTYVNHAIAEATLRMLGAA